MTRLALPVDIDWRRWALPMVLGLCLLLLLCGLIYYDRKLVSLMTGVPYYKPGSDEFRKLFRDAFPVEAAQADAKGDLNLLINDITVLRATATFLRTTVTRDTPWDRFLAGDNHALSAPQRRGAKLFFTQAQEGGAGCFSCHSGPMLNKQVNDPDVAGAGRFVEENFYNLGLADHPLQALNRAARKDPGFRDDGRREITGRDDDAF